MKYIRGGIDLNNKEIEVLPDLSDVILTGFFYCSNNKHLKSLDGCPKEVQEDFECSKNKLLNSLKGSPKKIGGDFTVTYNKNILNLDGCPEEVGGNFTFYSLDFNFTEEQVRAVCDVKGEVYV